METRGAITKVTPIVTVLAVMLYGSASAASLQRTDPAASDRVEAVDQKASAELVSELAAKLRHGTPGERLSAATAINRVIQEIATAPDSASPDLVLAIISALPEIASWSLYSCDKAVATILRRSIEQLQGSEIPELKAAAAKYLLGAKKMVCTSLPRLMLGGIYSPLMGTSGWVALTTPIPNSEGELVLQGGASRSGWGFGIGAGLLERQNFLNVSGAALSLLIQRSSNTPSKGTPGAVHIGPELEVHFSFFRASVGVGFGEARAFSWSLGIAVPVW